MSPRTETALQPSRWTLRKALLAGTVLVTAVAGISAMAGSPAPNALPTGGQVTAGQAAISQNGPAMTITQTSSKAILNWQGFDIGKQASVTFQQPDATAMALNRVTAGDASQIEGRLSANGQVVLVNPNGVVFGAGATVNAGGLVASTLDIKDADFQAGTMTFQRNGATGAVVNHGTITTARGGYAALIGAKVTTDGLIEARMGTVALAAGEAAVLNFDGTSLVGVQVQPSTVAALIDAGGIIRTGGGKVLLTAGAANQLLGGAINADGVIEATSLSKVGGRVSLQTGGSLTIGDRAATASAMVDAASRPDAAVTTRGDGGAVAVTSRATAFHRRQMARAGARGGASGGSGGHARTSGERLKISGAKAVSDALNETGLPNCADVTIATTASSSPVTGSGANGDIVVASTLPTVSVTLLGMTGSSTAPAKFLSSDQDELLVDGVAEGATDCVNLDRRIGFVCQWRAIRMVMPAASGHARAPAMLYSVVSEVEAARFASDRIMP